MPLVVPADVDLSALGIYNVKDPAYGAAGDGVTDDTVAIQSAINAAYEAGGGIVYLPKSQYLINGNMSVGDRPSKPGGNDGKYVGTTPIPNIPHTATPYPLTGITTANDGVLVGNVSTMLPNGPLLVFENVILCGDGPEQTVLLAEEDIYGGYMLAPAGKDGNDRQSGVVVATPNWWADCASDLSPPFQDGFFAHNVFIRDLSIDCQGQYDKALHAAGFSKCRMY